MPYRRQSSMKSWENCFFKKCAPFAGKCKTCGGVKPGQCWTTHMSPMIFYRQPIVFRNKLYISNPQFCYKGNHLVFAAHNTEQPAIPLLYHIPVPRIIEPLWVMIELDQFSFWRDKNGKRLRNTPGTQTWQREASGGAATKERQIERTRNQKLKIFLDVSLLSAEWLLMKRAPILILRYG